MLIVPIVEVVEARQPEVLAELRRRRLLRQSIDATPEPPVLVDGQPYRDRTQEATEAADTYLPEMDHAAYRRVRGRVRQVKQG